MPRYARIFFSIVLLFSFCACNSATRDDPSHDTADFSRLLELIQLENKYEPLFTFNNYEEKFDLECHNASLEYFQQHPDLIRKIKSDLDSTRLKWQMVKNRKRLAFVPESRFEYAELYLGYCRKVIDFIIAETKLDNPYVQIRNPVGNFPEFAKIDNRVTVFLVHNLAKQYAATYSFSTDSDQSKVDISLSGTVFTGEIGSYASILEVQDDGRLVFERNPYTIWQNSAKSPVNALILPLEETLHIALRPYTETAIEDQWNDSPLKTVREARKIADYWIKVEEAAAGGMAHFYFPQVAQQFIKNIAPEEIDRALDQRARQEKYRYLKKGIRIVKNVGPINVLSIYRNAPQKFRDMLAAHKNS